MNPDVGEGRTSGTAYGGGDTVAQDEKNADKTGDDLAARASKLGEQAKEKAAEAAHRAGPLAEQAKEKAAEAIHRAAPYAAQAKEKATEAAHKAGTVAAHGVESTAGGLDKLTQGKYSDKIKSVSTKLEHLLDPNGGEPEK
jgi:hypothetical protein